MARLIRIQTGVPASASTLVASSAKTAQAARLAVKAAVVADVRRGLDVGALERLVSEFSASDMDDRGF